MNENGQELDSLAQDLGRLEKEYQGILTKEREIAHKLRDTADTARRRVKQVLECGPREPMRPPHQGFVR